jgi:hypothetical protein
MLRPVVVVVMVLSVTEFRIYKLEFEFRIYKLEFEFRIHKLEFEFLQGYGALPNVGTGFNLQLRI